MISRVMLDLDDVCNHFCMTALKYAGATSLVLPYEAYPEVAGWDIVMAANLLKEPGRPEFGVVEFWESLDRNFWAGIPPAPYLRNLLAALVWAVGEENIFIATSATKSPECLAGKLEWIHRFLPKFLHRRYMIGSHKEVLANPFTLLIDDRRGNVDKFRKAGGHAILVPRPWNTMEYHTAETSIRLQTELTQYFNFKVTL